MNLLNNLERGFLNSFQHIDIEIVEKTIESLPRRIDKIIALSGGTYKVLRSAFQPPPSPAFL